MVFINKEKDLYGFYLTNHPVSFYKDKYDKIIDLCDIKNYFNKIIDTIVMIDKITIIKTKDKEEMAFITASDDVDTIEYVLFPKVYNEYKNLEKNDIIKVNGKVERRNNYQIIVNFIEKCI
jgi:DNA polymerase-3 subunit alpha